MSEFDRSKLDSKVYECLKSQTQMAGNASSGVVPLADLLEYTERIVRESLTRLERDGRVRRTDSLGNRWSIS